MTLALVHARKASVSVSPRREPRSNAGVSICIPNWNHRNYLGRSIGSALRAAEALRREGVGCQVLVIDDFSRDGSQRFLLSAAMRDEMETLDILLSPENKGLRAVRNLALAQAKFNIVCFLDADNELIAENIFYFWRAITETGAAMVYGNLLMSNGVRTIKLLSNDVLRDDIYDANYIDAFCLVDADRLDALGGYYDKQTPYPEDWEVLLHLIAENAEIVFVPMALGIYHIAEYSMVQTKEWENDKIHRIFNQRETGFPVGFRARRIYHPDLGWL